MSVATSTAIGLAAAATAAGTAIAAHETGSAAKSAATTTSDAATKAAQIQADAADKAAELQAQTSTDALNYTKQQSALSLAQYNAQQQRLQPYRNLGNFAMGLPNDPAPAPLVLPTIPDTSGGSSSMPGTTPSGSTTQDPVQSYMLGLLNSGVDPSSVAAQTNAKFGNTIGTGALYYPSNNTIGLPNFYVAGPQQGQTGPWTVTPRQGAGTSTTPTTAASTASTLLPLTQATMNGSNQTQINPASAAGPIASVTGPVQATGYRSLAQLGGY